MRNNKKRKLTETSVGTNAHFVANLEFASTQIPHSLALAGWLIHDSQHAIRWGILAHESYNDISDKVMIFSRPDLKGHDESLTCSRVGFVALIDGKWTSKETQLTIGTAENPIQLSLPIKGSRTDDLQSYFPQSHQLFRFATAQCIASLSEVEIELLAPIVNVVLPEWTKEVPLLDGTLHRDVSAGIDHRICTANGDCYVEGWLGSQANRNYTLSGCLFGVHASKTLLQRSAFHRPDIAGSDEFSGFAFVGRAQLAAGRNPVLLLQAHFIDTDEVTYHKVNLKQVDAQSFAQTFWSRTLDIHKISRKALRQILTFTRRSRDHSSVRSTAKRPQRYDDQQKIGALILKNSEESALRNLFLVTSRQAEFDFSKVVLLAADPASGEIWWPNIGEMLVLSPVFTLGDALKWIDAPLLLIVDASVMTNSQFAADVKAAAKILAAQSEIECVILADKGFVNGRPSSDHLSIAVKGVDCVEPTWFHLSKGTTIPPILLRTDALREFDRHAWPQPSAALALRNYLKGASTGPGVVWLETANVEAFYARPYAPALSPDQTNFLYQIDARL